MESVAVSDLKPGDFGDESMKRILSATFALSLFVTSALAGGSTINTGIPATGAPLASAPIRNNFVAAATDINNLISMFAGNSAPASPSKIGRAHV